PTAEHREWRRVCEPVADVMVRRVTDELAFPEEESMLVGDAPLRRRHPARRELEELSDHEAAREAITAVLEESLRDCRELGLRRARGHEARLLPVVLRALHMILEEPRRRAELERDLERFVDVGTERPPCRRREVGDRFVMLGNIEGELVRAGIDDELGLAI